MLTHGFQLALSPRVRVWLSRQGCRAHTHTSSEAPEGPAGENRIKAAVSQS